MCSGCLATTWELRDLAIRVYSTVRYKLSLLVPRHGSNEYTNCVYMEELKCDANIHEEGGMK